MTSISLTSGEILDIITSLKNKSDKSYDNGEESLAWYYQGLMNKFEVILTKLDDLPGEQRETNLVMAL